MSAATSILPLSAHLKNLYASSCRDVCRRYELSQTEFDILDVLSSDCGLDTAAGISKLRYIKKANISTAVDRLTVKSLIRRRPDDKDKRIVHLDLTEAASEAVKAIREAQDAFVARLKESLTECELATLASLMEKLLISSPEPCGSY